MLAGDNRSEVLLRRTWFSGEERGEDLVALGADRTVRWSFPLLALGEVAVADDTVYFTAFDADGEARLIARTGDGQIWQAELAGDDAASELVLAGDLVYVVLDSEIRVFAADGCGAPTCAELATLTTGATDTIDGMSVTGGLVHISTSNRLLAAGPTS